MIRIFLVCKNDLFLRVLEPQLNGSNISIAGVCNRPTDAVEQFVHSKADIVVLDANWINSDLSGIDILTIFLKFDETVKVIFVTHSYEDKLAERVKKFGAMGYFYRNVRRFDAIVDCITNVYNGDLCVTEK